MLKEHHELLAAGQESHAFWGRGRAASDDTEFRFATDAEVYLDVLQTRLDGRAGFHSKEATRRLLARLDEIQPDVVHLHNLHGYYVNIKLLFDWLSTNNVQVEWTLHDCWAFTGHCAYFTYAQCAQWKQRCASLGTCPQYRSYPKALVFSSVKRNFSEKEALFTLLPANQLKIITPSNWLAGLVGQSFLSKYPVEVRHNSVDTTTFKDTPSDFRTRYGLENKFMILGVASPWTERKGLPDFLRLANELDERSAVVLVGLSKKQIREVSNSLPEIKPASSTDNPNEGNPTADVAETNYESPAISAQVVLPENARAASVDYHRSSSVSFAGLTATVAQGEGCQVLMFERTSDARQLAAVYSAADVFFNPTMEDNYPTVNLEAEACGTNVITYDTGGCAETVQRRGSRVVMNFAQAIDNVKDLLVQGATHRLGSDD